MRRIRTRSLVSRSSLALLLALAALVAFRAPDHGPPREALAVAPEAEPLRIAPASSREARPVSLPRGEIHLVDYLKALADSTAMTVYLVGEEHKTATIQLDEATTRVTFEAAMDVLERAGFYLSEDKSQGKRFFWVQPRIEKTRRRGALVRRSPGGAPATGESGPRAEGEPLTGGIDALRVFRRDDGGPATYLVQYEAASREEAEEVVSLIRAAIEAKHRK